MENTKFDEIVESNSLFDLIKRPKRGKRNKDFYFVSKRDVVVILPVTKSGNIIIERQFRPPLNYYIYEIPAGHVEKGENLKASAKRELREETGITASKFTMLVETYPSPGVLTSTEYIYLAQGLKYGKTSMDDDEKITIIRISPKKALSWIKSGKIKDAKTIVAILYYLKMT